MRIEKIRFKEMIFDLRGVFTIVLFGVLLGMLGFSTNSSAAPPHSGAGIDEIASVTSFSRNDMPATLKKDQGIIAMSHENRDIPPEKRAEIVSHVKALHVPFIANQGQVDKKVKFYAKTFGGAFYVSDNGELVYSMFKVEGDTEENHVSEGRGGGSEQFLSLVIKEELIGAEVSGVKGGGVTVAMVSYFKGNDPSKWESGIPTYEYVSLGEVYKGINLNLKAYGNNIEKLFYVNPGASPEEIRLKLSGAKGIMVNKDGELEVSTELGLVSFTKPVAYQEKVPSNAKSSFQGGNIAESSSPHVVEGQGDEEKQFIEVAYIVDGDHYSFKLGDYDKTRPVIIDPLLASTFLGTGLDDIAFDIALDSAGNIYVAGTTSTSFPTAGTPYDSSFNGGRDVFISKFDANLSSLIASSLIGGWSDDRAYAMVLDSTGNVYVTGYTYSSDYPTAGTPYNSSYNNVFISKLDGNLSSLLASTFIGGSLGMEYASAITLDGAGNVYVTGYTWSSDYPTAGTPYDSSYNGSGDVFISKLDGNLSTLLASTFIGGSGCEFSFYCEFDSARILFDSAIVLDGTGNVYVTGHTWSSDYPTAGTPYDSSYNSSGDVFISKLDGNLSSLLASTFIGGSQYDHASAIVVDGTGNIYVTGWTYSSDYPTAGAPYDSSYNGGDAFVSKLNSNLSSLLASTFIGGSYGNNAYSMALDGMGNVYITGTTWSPDYPVAGAPYDSIYNGGSGDVFISKLNSNLSSNLASTFVGGSTEDHAHAIILDATGNVYVTGWTYSSDYPTAGTPYDSSHFGGGGNSAVFVSKIDTNLSVGSGDTDGDGLSDSDEVNIYGTDLNNPDTDGDGLPDGWEVQNGLIATNSTGTNGASGDPDGDGATNLQEYQSGTDPQNPSSYPPLIQSWAARYDSGNWDYGDCLALDGSGNVYVSGESYNGINSDIVTVKYNSSGTQLWASSYNNGYGDDSPGCPEVDASGNVYVSGSSSNGSNYDIVTLKYDTNGNLLWASRYDNGYGDERGSVAVDSSGNVYVAGSSSNGSNNDIVLLKYNSSGTQLWTKRYNNGYEEWATQLVLDGLGNIYVTGDSSNGSNYDIVMLKYDSSGTQLWVSRYDNGGWDSPGWAIAADGAGNVYVTGQSNDNIVTLMYSSIGTQLWARSYDNGWGDRGVNLALDGYGNVYVTGESSNGTNNDIVTVKYDYIGNQLWVQRYDGGGDDGGGWGGNRNAVDSGGNVYVMGNSHNGSNYDIVTLKYDTNGAQMGLARYDNGGDDSGGYKVAVDTSGNVYVTGSSSNGSNFDFVTVKYGATQTTGDVSRVTYLSTRSKIETGENVMIGGFKIEGSLPKTMLIRARGPSMTSVSGFLADPYLRLFSHDPLVNAYIAQNDNWVDQSDTLCAQKGYVCGSASDISTGGLAPCGGASSCSKESVILITLPPGTYSAVMEGVNSSTGVGLVQIKDVDPSTLTKLTYISTRARVQTGFDVMIGGFTIDAGTGNKQMLIRARGPSMTSVSGFLADPYLRLFSHDPLVNAYIAQNDNWGDQSDTLCAQKGYVCASATEISTGGWAPCGGAPSCSMESAILITVPPGTYSAVMSGVNDVIGVGLVQISDVMQ